MAPVWTILLLLGALLMRAGLISYAFGTARSRNAAGSVGRQILDWTVAVLAFWAVGLAIAQQDSNPYLGLKIGNLLGDAKPDLLLAGLVAVSIVGVMAIGSAAERSRLWPMLALSVVTAGLTLPVAMNWLQRGWLFTLADSADPGTAYVHLVGGVVALVAIKVIGPRDGKYNRDGSTNIITGHNLPAVLSGAFLSLVGGVLLIAASPSNAPEKAAANVVLSTAAAVLVAAIYCQLKFIKLDLPVLAASLIAGVVAASGSPATMAGWMAVFGGAVAGLVVVVSLVTIDFKLHLDDVSGAVSIHGVIGAWSMLLAGAGRGETLAERGRAVLIQLAAVAAVTVLAAVVTWVTLKIVAAITPLRAKSADEFDGLDIAEHDTADYPDFQLNSIR
jgi:Amt family ammonium transporter